MSANFTPFGLAVGHESDATGATGVTVIRGVTGPFRAAAAIIGRATGTRELDALSPAHLVDRVDAIVLTGGSAYGLGCADGVMRWMEERGRGFPVSGGVVPIVPAAVVFDLAPLGSYRARPTPDMAYAACDRASSTDVAEGSVGAGTGTTVGKALGIERAMKAGLGCAIVETGGLFAGAIAVVNAIGDVRDGNGRIIAGARGENGEFLDIAAQLRGGAALRSRFSELSMKNTTLAVVMTTAALSRLELAQLAKACASALARRITPVGTTYDGDVVFAIAPLAGSPAPLLQIETMTTHALETAIERSVRLARGRDGVPGLADS